MIMTALDLLNQVMIEIGVKNADEALSASDAQLGLTRLNMLLGSAAAGTLKVRASITRSFTVVAGTVSYTIGAAGVWVVAEGKPVKIDNAYVHDANGYDTTLEIMDKPQYNRIAYKTAVAARPSVLCYDPGLSQQAAQVGTVLLYPAPDTTLAYQAVLDMWLTLTEFPNLTTQVTFEPMYYEYLLYNMAERLWRPFYGDNAPIPPDIRANAARTRNMIATVVSKTPIAYVDVPGSGVAGGSYDIYTDEVR